MVKFILKIGFIGLISWQSVWANDIASTTPTTPTNTVEQSRQQVSEVMFDKDFAIVTPRTRWKAKEPKEEYRPNSSPNWNFEGIIDLFSIVVKTLLLGILLAFAYWLYLKRDIWQAWFAMITKQKLPSKKLDVANHTNFQLAPMWQGLPEKSDLAQAVRQHLANKHWLMALSILYRGTLREILTLHDLAITRASTEQQCQWLLQKSATCQPQESAYFQALVNLWSQIAYGKKLPHPDEVSQLNNQIEQLLQQWQQLYANETENVA